MVALCAVTFQLRGVLQADCECPDQSIYHSRPSSPYNSFAFVEYESRRDADDAYHEMHNKRLGRDDLLKIEVPYYAGRSTSTSLTCSSGLVLLLLHPGALTLEVTVVLLQAVAIALLAEVAQEPLLDAVTILRERMIVVRETMIAAIGTVLEALRTETVR